MLTKTVLRFIFLPVLLVFLSENVFAQPTGINSAGTDSLLFFNNGSKSMVVGVDGSVRLGTVGLFKPTALLQMNSTTRGLLIPRMTTTQRSAIVSPETGLLVFNTTTNQFTFYDGAAWEVFMDSNGSGSWTNGGTNVYLTTGTANVGIGTSTPAATLDVDSDGGTILIPRKSTTGDPAGGVNGMIYYNGFDNKFRVFENGVWADWIPAGAPPVWNLLGNTGTTPGTNFIGTTDLQDLAIRTNNTEKMRVLANGNVGIGTTSPAAKLNIVAPFGFADDIVLISESGTSNRMAFTSGVTAATIGGGTTTRHDIVISHSTGNVGIGSGLFPAAQLDVRNSGTEDILNLYDNTTEVMTVLDGGNVGIGTSTPAAKLDVDSDGGTILIPRKSTTGDPVGGVNGMIYYSGFDNKFRVFENGVWVDWIPSGASPAWDLLGNTGTTPGTNFIGTTDAVNLDFRTNNVIRARITQKGQIEVLNTGQSVFLGEGAGAADDLTANQNVFIGYLSGNMNTTGYYNTAVGRATLYNTTTGVSNTALGNSALLKNTTGSYNTAVGNLALYSNTIGNGNTVNGRQALWLNTIGSNNTALGYLAGDIITTGTDNTFVGYNADATVATLTNATAIGANASVAQSNSLILGNAVNVGIGTSSPQNGLHIATSGGQFTSLQDGIHAGIDAVGNAHIELVTNGGVPYIDFLNDNINDFDARIKLAANGDLRVLGTSSQFIVEQGNVGIGTTSPAAKLDVNGSIKVGANGTAISQIQHGYIGDGTSGSAGSSGSVVFSSAFSITPKVFLQVEELDNNGATSVRIIAISNTGFSWYAFTGSVVTTADRISWMAIGN